MIYEQRGYRVIIINKALTTSINTILGNCQFYNYGVLTRVNKIIQPSFKTGDTFGMLFDFKNKQTIFYINQKKIHHCNLQESWIVVLISLFYQHTIIKINHWKIH